MVYLPSPDEGYEFCHPVNDHDFETFNVQVNGLPRQATWKPVPIRLVTGDEGIRLAESDSPWLGSHALIFRQQVLDALPMISASGELLKLAPYEARLHVFNPLEIRDALDKERSSLVRFSDGRIMHIKKYAFNENAIRGVDFFKIPDLRVSPTFVSKRVVDAWISAGLRGLRFKQLSGDQEKAFSTLG